MCVGKETSTMENVAIKKTLQVVALENITNKIVESCTGFFNSCIQQKE